MGKFSELRHVRDPPPPVTVSSRQNAQQSKSSENSYDKSKIIFTIALRFLANIKYSQYVSTRLSVGIQWTILTAGHLVYLRPCPAVGFARQQKIRNTGLTYLFDIENTSTATIDSKPQWIYIPLSALASEFLSWLTEWEKFVVSCQLFYNVSMVTSLY